MKGLSAQILITCFTENSFDASTNLLSTLSSLPLNTSTWFLFPVSTIASSFEFTVVARITGTPLKCVFNLFKIMLNKPFLNYLYIKLKNISVKI